MSPLERDLEPTPTPVPTRPRGLELLLVTFVALAILLPGIWSYTLVDPWETHYGEVSRRMLQDHDWVHTQWQNEGFRSKPVLTMWVTAVSMKSLGLAQDGGYSGELVSTRWTMFALRLPFVLFGVMGLVLGWWMVARMIGRRAAWLGLLVLGTTPFYFFVARQAIPDITLVACLIGSVATFALAGEVGDQPLEPLFTIGRRRRVAIDHRHLFALIIGGFLFWQIGYYIYYFTVSPRLAGIRLGGLHPGLLLALPMLFGVGLLAFMEAPVPVLRTVAYWITAVLGAFWFAVTRIIGLAVAGRLPSAGEIAPTTTSRQIYLYWCWAFVGISILGKGPVALAIIGFVALFYVVMLGRWRDFFDDRFEIVRGFALILLIAIPWHIAMYFKEGRGFLHEYVVVHLLDRAGAPTEGDRGTFAYYLTQTGYGMFVWAGLLPSALAALVLRSRSDTSAGRGRLVIAIWAIVGFAFFTLVQTKYHHYILPAVPAFALAIGIWLDDVLAGRARSVGVAALAGAGIVLLIANDMMSEQKIWIEMFCYRYDRPWPDAPPYSIDVSDGFLALGVCAAIAMLVMALPRLAKIGVALLGSVAIAAAIWAMAVYMPIAAEHWGMRDAMVYYYQHRDIHGARLQYWGARDLASDWSASTPNGVRDHWTLRTYVPDDVQEGQPMDLHITVRSIDDRTTENDVDLIGKVGAVDDDAATIDVVLPPSETAKLASIVKSGLTRPTSGRAPIRVVDGDRLIAWQLYWRGENFWSQDEIWGQLPEMQTAFKDTDNVKFLKYLNDRTLCPEGRRYWVITEAGRISNLKSIVPTQRAKDTFQVEDMSSNKFTLASFVL